MLRNIVRFFIGGVSLMVVIAFAEPESCGTNEQLGNCGPICEETCDNPDLSGCAATTCAGVGCQCKPGYRRNSENNSCVLASECPTKKCKENEVLAACGARCEGNCSHPGRPYICSLIRCATQGCQCDLSRGYVRNAQGECVRNQDDKCCAAQLVCPANSEPRLCGGVCESSCANPAEIFCKLDPTNCTIDCQCKRGFVRNELTKECVRSDQCYREVGDKTASQDFDSKNSDLKNSDLKDSDSKDSDSKDSDSEDSDESD